MMGSLNKCGCDKMAKQLGVFTCETLRPCEVANERQP
jgi:hypothetical protein